MHNWQDYLIAVGSIIFIVALMPTLLSKQKPHLSTSLMTGTVLMAFAITYLTLKLWFAAATTAMTSVQWFVLAVQKILQKSPNNSPKHIK